MKIRSDYVSNSSSSSFVIANCELIERFNITKQDILDALIDTYGREEYGQNVKQREKYAKEHPEYCKKELKYGHFGPFWVYDMTDKKDKKEAIDIWGKLLKGWDANNCRKITDEDSKGKGCIANGSEYSTYREIMDKLNDLYGISFWDIREYAVNPIKKNLPLRFVRSDKKDPKTGCYGHYVPVEKEILDFTIKLRKDLGIMTNLDVIKSKVAKFFVHADDNELYVEKLSENGNGEEHWDAEKKDWVKCYSSKWESKSYTFDRICEIVLEWLVKNGRVNLNDQAFMDKMKLDEKYLSQFDKEQGELWDFANGKNYTWKDLKHDVLTWNMHEG